MSQSRAGRGELVVAAAMGLTAACSADVATAPPADTLTQVVVDTLINVGRRVVVLVVDDETTSEAAAIRAATTAALPSTLERVFRDSLPGLDTDWLRADLRVVVVHPSVAGSQGVVGPSDDPGFAVISEHASLADIDAMADAAAREIDSVGAPADGAYTPIDATMRVLDLLTHTRTTADARENALLASLGTPETVSVLVATSRDDNGDGGVNGGVWTPGVLPEILTLVVATPLAAGAGGCDDQLEPATRLGQWATVMRQSVPQVDAIDPFCPQGATVIKESGLLVAVVADRYPLCLPAAPLTRSGGGVSCMLEVTIPDDAPCATYPGMIDPRDVSGAAQPSTAAAGVGPDRKCEVEELPAPQVDECSALLPCPDCPPGWCVTTRASPLCPLGMFRFVHGAVPRGGGLLHIACDLEESEALRLAP